MPHFHLHSTTIRAIQHLYGLDETILNSLLEPFIQHLEHSIDVILLILLTFPQSQISLSFNGGKDSTRPISDSLRNTLEHSLKTILSTNLLNSLFSDPPTLQTLPIVFLGARSTDPLYQNLDVYAPTDTVTGWPALLRVLPLLHWTYSDIWTFLRTFNIEYVSLYDQGFTSLGKKADTVRNPALFKNGVYLPAYTLQNDSLERDGRV
ncbi:putative FAD synthetase [Blattamonas nauphoetae]|uniref:FAD synthase n=1 Tax=Blattamonas nauphoetae TaxID=2049346 RepID=A0ABQ9YG19_9EUKA|nr:putative FAD synthetase [Blattamonas nauphoetae]